MLVKHNQLESLQYYHDLYPDRTDYDENFDVHCRYCLEKIDCFNESKVCDSCAIEIEEIERDYT